MAITFPSSPSTNDTFTVNGRTYVWDGTAWKRVNAEIASVVPSLEVTGDFTGDTDTLYVDSTNDRVGVGTTTPSEELDVVGDIQVSGRLGIGSGIGAELDIKGASNPEIRLQSTDSSDPFLYFGDQVDAVRGGIGYDTSANALQLRGYNNSTRMAIDSSGNVGIGTTSPNRTLDVVQASSGATPYNLTGGIDIESSNITGLNVMSPNTGYGRIYFGAPVTATAGAIEYIHNATVTDGYMKFRAGNADRMHILGNGDVGIGTGTPSVKLHVNGEIVHASQWAGCAGPSSWASAYTNNWSQARDSGSFMTATSTGIEINRSGRYHVIAGQRANSTTDTYIGIGETGNRTTLDTRTTGVWSHDHTSVPNGWTKSVYVGYLASGEKLTAGAPSTTYSGRLLFASLGYAGFLTAIWLGD
jgi:hypothetical protein